jgi:hypothetical protein
MIITEKDRNSQRNTCSSATLSFKNPTWTGIDSNPDLRDERSATNTLSSGKFRLVVTDVSEELSTSVFKACPKDERSSLRNFGTYVGICMMEHCKR